MPETEASCRLLPPSIISARRARQSAKMGRTTTSTSIEPLLQGKLNQEYRSNAWETMKKDRPAEAALDTHRSKGLFHFDEIPQWQRDNEYILSGYRSTSGSLRRSLRSVFAVHNETVAINSHLFGSALFYALPFYFWKTVHARTSEATTQDYLVFTIYFVNVATCFLLSSICHIIWNHSPSYASSGNKLDYLGIILLMWGASVPSIYYGLHCNLTLQKFYWALMTAVALTCAIFTCTPSFCSPKFRSYRAAMYSGLGLTGVIFATHGILLHGWHEQSKRMALDWMILMALLNFIGAGMYAARIPEKRFPYTFDIIGGSHQIFHSMVILAGLAHHVGMLKALDYTRGPHGSCELGG